MRTASGQWAKGSSGNPGGRPRVAAEVREALEAATPRAVARLVALIDDDDPRIALRAAEVVLERVLGPPPAAADFDVFDDGKVDTVDFVPRIAST